MPRRAQALWAIALGVAASVGGPAASAAPMMFVDRAQFDSALTAAVSQRPDASIRLENFDGVPSGTVIPDDGDFAGIHYTYKLPRSGGIETVVQITDGNRMSTTSPPNFLGTKDLNAQTGYVFQHDDELRGITLNTTLGIGMYIIGGSPLRDGAIELSIFEDVGGSEYTVELDTSALQQTLWNGSTAYFLGIVEPLGFRRFEVAALDYASGWNIDDLITAPVSEPATLVLVVLGMAGALLSRGSARNDEG